MSSFVSYSKLGLNYYVVSEMLKSGNNINYSAFCKDDLIYILRICRELYLDSLKKLKSR